MPLSVPFDNGNDPYWFCPKLRRGGKRGPGINWDYFGLSPKQYAFERGITYKQALEEIKGLMIPSPS